MIKNAMKVVLGLSIASLSVLGLSGCSVSVEGEDYQSIPLRLILNSSSMEM